MHRLLSALFVFCSAAVATYATEINLTPKASVRELDGIQFPQLEFADGKRTITYESPRGWTYAPAGEHRIAFYVPDKVQADASIEWVKQPLLLTADGLKQIETAAAGLLPNGSQDVTVAKLTPSSLRVNG